MQLIDTVRTGCLAVSGDDAGLCRLELAVLGALATVVAVMFVLVMARWQ